MPFSLDVLGYIAAFCTTLSFLPQAILTIRTKDTESLSLGMYSLFTFGVTLWLIYGIHKNDYAIVIGNTVTLILSGIILLFKIKSVITNRVKQHKHSD
jgi:MtN3 and saliva related transmembrane protein